MAGFKPYNISCDLGLPWLSNLSETSKSPSYILTKDLIHFGRVLDNIFDLLNSTNLTSNIKQNVSLLTTIPGIGELTAITLVAEIGDFSRFKNSKSLVAYLGIDPSISCSRCNNAQYS